MRPLARTPVLVLSAAALLVVAMLAAACGLSDATDVIGGEAAPAPAGQPPVGAEVAGLVGERVVVPAELAGAPFDTPRVALVPPGFTLSVWARLPKPRLAAWTPDGALLVSQPSTGRVVRLVPGPDGRARPTVLLDGLNQPHGLAFAGSTLYVAQSDRVDAWSYADGAATAPRPVATGLPDAKSSDLGGAYAHALKSVAVGEDGAVYVSIGSTGNVSPQDRLATPERAAILRVPPGGGAPQTYARGVRNGTGLAIAPDRSLWTAVNNRDNIAYPYDRPYGRTGPSDLGRVMQAYVNDHPPEELARLTPGRDLGWPYCNPDPDVERGAPDSPQVAANPRFVRDQETNADGSRLDCASLAPVEQTMGAHAAPLGMSFTTSPIPGPWGTGALVGVHGSWNREPQRAPEVSFYSWNGRGLDNLRTLVGGFQALDGSRWGRPVAAVQGPDGAVYVTDDGAGAVYRLAPTGR